MHRFVRCANLEITTLHFPKYVVLPAFPNHTPKGNCNKRWNYINAPLICATA